MKDINIRYYTKSDFEKWQILFSDMREKQNQWDWDKENIENLTRERFEKKLQKHADERVIGDCHYFCVEELESGKLVGICLLTKITEVSAEIGFQLNNKFWGKGYGTIIVDELNKISANQNLKELIAYVNVKNEVSTHILTKMGFNITTKNDKDQLVLIKFIASL